MKIIILTLFLAVIAITQAKPLKILKSIQEYFHPSTTTEHWITGTSTYAPETRQYGKPTSNSYSSKIPDSSEEFHSAESHEETRNPSISNNQRYDGNYVHNQQNVPVENKSSEFFSAESFEQTTSSDNYYQVTGSSHASNPSTTQSYTSYNQELLTNKPEVNQQDNHREVSCNRNETELPSSYGNTFQQESTAIRSTLPPYTNNQDQGTNYQQSGFGENQQSSYNVDQKGNQSPYNNQGQSSYDEQTLGTEQPSNTFPEESDGEPIAFPVDTDTTNPPTGIRYGGESHTTFIHTTEKASSNKKPVPVPQDGGKTIIDAPVKDCGKGKRLDDGVCRKISRK